MDLLTVSFRAGAAVWKAPGTHGEELIYLASGRGLEGQLSPRQRYWQNPLFLCWAVPLPVCRCRSPSTWLTSFVCPALLIPETLPSQILGPPKLPVAFLYKQPVLAHVTDFPKISQRFTNPKQAASGFGVYHTSCWGAPSPALVAVSLGSWLCLSKHFIWNCKTVLLICFLYSSPYFHGCFTKVQLNLGS